MQPEDSSVTGPISDMLSFARHAQEFIDGRRRAEIHTDTQLAFALARALEVMGEAATRVNPDLRMKYPAIQWRSIIGMRNVLIHGYTRVDYELLWDITSEQVPPLIEQLQAILDTESGVGE